MKRKKAIFINGGAGRVLCSIPALQKLAETDKDFIIVSESYDGFFKGNPELHKRFYFPNHKNLFADILKHSDCVTLEPYKVFEYYNQKCSLIQAFNKELNGALEETEPAKIYFTPTEINKGKQSIDQARELSGKKKIVVIQPTGSGVKDSDGGTYVDESGRSIKSGDLNKLINSISDEYGVFIMSDNKIALDKEVGSLATDLREWAAIINSADYFIGCDSVGQHIAASVGTPSTVILGSTFPENISYPKLKNFKIIDLGKENRIYSPIRLCQDEIAEMNNSDLINFRENTISLIRKNMGLK